MQRHLVENMSLVIMALCLVAFPGDAAVAGESERANQAQVDFNPKELDLVLLGTVMNDPGNSMAIIQVGETGEQALYRLGDVVEGGRVTKILHDSITLTFAETEVELPLTGGGTAATAMSATSLVQPPLRQTEQGFWRVERETLDDVGRSTELIRDVTPLGDEGVRIDKVKADGLLHKLGLQQGDIISSVDARMVGAGLTLQRAIAQIRTDEPLLRLEIHRQGQMDVLYYEFDAPSSTLDSRSRQN